MNYVILTEFLYLSNPQALYLEKWGYSMQKAAIWFKHNNACKILALCPTQNKGYEFLWEFVCKICICLHLYFIDLSSFLILFFKSSSFLRKTNTIWYHLCVESKPWHKWAYLWNRNRLTDTEIRIVVAKEEKWRDELGVWD